MARRFQLFGRRHDQEVGSEFVYEARQMSLRQYGYGTGTDYECRGETVLLILEDEHPRATVLEFEDDDIELCSAWATNPKVIRRPATVQAPAVEF